jgi:F-type H+-transporting ATPase subunit epsilon
MAEANVRCTVVTPERTVLDETVDFVAVPMYDGELGVAPGRVPLIGRLGTGELRTRKSGTICRFFVDGGFVQVRENTVTILTARAIPAESINEQQLESQLAELRQPAATPELRDQQQQQAAKNRRMLQIARKK